MTIPYTLKANEKADGMKVWYIGADNVLQKVEGAKYDADLKAIVFETDHFSTYAVAYRASAVSSPSSELGNSSGGSGGICSYSGYGRSQYSGVRICRYSGFVFSLAGFPNCPAIWKNNNLRTMRVELKA